MNKICNILTMLFVVIGVLGVGYLLYLQFTNPDMTETRFAITYYKEIAVTLISFIIANILARK